MNEVQDLAEKIYDLHRAGSCAFAFPTYYDEDLDELIWQLDDLCLISSDSFIEIGLVNDSAEGIYQADAFWYHRNRIELELPKDRVMCEALYSLRTGEQPVLPAQLLMTVANMADPVGKSEKKSNFPVKGIIIRNLDNYFGNDRDSFERGNDIAAAISSICRARQAGRKDIMLLFTVGDVSALPPMLEPYVNVQQIPLPSGQRIEAVINRCVSEHNKGKSPQNQLHVIKGLKKEMVQYFRGFREFEIEKILRYSFERGDPFANGGEALFQMINEEKRQLTMKRELLEWVDEKEEKVGGLQSIQSWLERKAAVYNNLDRAGEYGVSIPKGVLLAGLPGSGKTLVAKTAKAVFKLPLIKMDIGRLMGMYVGQSEQNLRNAIKLAEMMSPCVLWIDELEKGFNNSGNTHEVTTRMIGYFLTWLQEKSCPCFVIATANNIHALPPEFFRKGRFDEKFYTFMPSEEECVSIFKVHLDKRKKNIENYERSLVVKEEKEILAGEYRAVLTRVMKETVSGGKKKFLNGADIGAIVSEAFELLFLKRLNRNKSKEADHSYVFAAEEIETALKEALNETKTYGETNIRDIARTWLNMREHNFRPSVEKVILPFESLDQRTGRFKPEKSAGKDYDSVMSEVLREQIEEIIKQGGADHASAQK